jgi:hypothetical protein
MRKNLAPKNGVRTRFIGVVDRFGARSNWNGFPEETVCLKDVKFLDGKEATDHIWFVVGKRIKSLDLAENDVVEFEARVKKYIKGYVNWRHGIDNRELDFKLSNPTKLKKLEIKNIEKWKKIGTIDFGQ